MNKMNLNLISLLEVAIFYRLFERVNKDEDGHPRAKLILQIFNLLSPFHV